MNVTLVYPPNRNIPGSPYGALPLLAGCVGAAGHAATIVDANLLVFEQLLKTENVAALQDEFEGDWKRLRDKPELTPMEAHTLQAMAPLGMVPFEELLHAEQAGRDLKTLEQFLEPDKVNRAYATISNLLRVAYARNAVFCPGKAGMADELHGYLESEFDNPISRLVNTTCMEAIAATAPDVVAVSIPFSEQLVEGLALLKAVKRAFPDVVTIVGGAMITSYQAELCSDARFYNYADYAMPGEAEQSFPAFLDGLEAGADLSQAANLWSLDADGAPRRPARIEISDLNLAAAPDYSTIAVGRYFLPYTIANYQTSRGCYYGKCTFCSSSIKGGFRFRRPELAIADIEHIQAQTGIKHFILWDPLTSPRIMKSLALWNRARPQQEQIFWGAETKFEKFFTDRQYTDLLYAGGARFMQFGFESGNQRVLDLMVKGNDLNRVGDMLDSLSASKIAVSVQWFIGFPGATEAEDRESYQYLNQRRDAVQLSSYMGTFSLSPEDDIWQTGGDLLDVDVFQQEDGRWDYSYRGGQERVDRTPLHHAYMARGDAEAITRMAFYIYLTEAPERVREITHWTNGGGLPFEWQELAPMRPSVPRETYLTQFDFDPFESPSQADFEAAGRRLPAQQTGAAYVTNSSLAYRLSDEEWQLCQLSDGERTAAEILDLCGGAEELQQAFLLLVARGILRVPLDVKCVNPVQGAFPGGVQSVAS